MNMQSKTIIRFDSCGKQHRILQRIFDFGYIWEDELPVFYPKAKATVSRDTWNLTPYQEKEDPTMQVSYNGFTGELVKLEQYSCGSGIWTYELHIYDSEKKVTHSFTGVKLEGVKFLGGAVSLGG